MSTGPNAGRIDELSAQLCARLSYAAAKVEREWEYSEAEGKYVYSRRNSLSTSPKAARQIPRQTAQSPRVRKPVSPLQRQFNGARMRKILEMGDGPMFDSTVLSEPHHITDVKDRPLSLDMRQIPHLSPPADIVSGALNNPKRRSAANDQHSNDPSHPNFSPNQRPILTQPSSASSSFGDGVSSVSVVPGTPSQPPFSQLSSTPSNSIHPLAKQRTPSQNALMEQDAIESLLFMSSPENSGYFSNSQQHKQPIPRSANITPLLSTFGSESASNSSAIEPECELERRPDTRPTPVINGSDNGAYARYIHQHATNGAGLEHEAGDEIDRMLDAMVDSDEEMELDWFPSSKNKPGLTPYAQHAPGALVQPRPPLQP